MDDRRAALRLWLTLLFLIPLMSGCRIGYYLKAGWGQSKIIFGKEDIEDVLERSSLEPEHRRKLELVREIKRFAVEQVGLADNDNYTTFYDLEGQPITHTVIACAPDSLTPYTWSFPIVGVLPYIGFFDKDEALSEARRLKKEGYDVAMWPASAYSTLGWFSDPVLSTMLDLDDANLVDLILHEQTHATIYVDLDTSFNETLGVFVGHAGAMAFFEARKDAKNKKLVRDRRADQVLVQKYTASLVEKLTEVYDSDRSRQHKLEEKKRVFARLRFEFRRDTRPQLLTSRFKYLGNLELNNALVTTLSLYNRDLELLETLHEGLGSDIRTTFDTLRDIADSSEPRKALEQKVAALESN